MADILGIKLSDLSFNEALIAIKKDLEGNKIKYAVTPNPEIILKALKDRDLKEIINKANYSFADGVGLKLIGALKGKKIKRVTGSDLSFSLLSLCEQEKHQVAIVIWSKGLSSAQEINSALEKKYPKLKFKIIESERQANLDAKVINEINNYGPVITFFSLGFPEQEKAAFNSLYELKSNRFIIGVGGTFDFLTGRTKRAPKLMRNIGLEWLWRLLIQPKRLKRIISATIIFSFKALTYRKK